MKHSNPPSNELAKEVAAFSLLTASIVLLWRENPLLFAVVVVESLAALSLWHERYDSVHHCGLPLRCIPNPTQFCTIRHEMPNSSLTKRH
jgi:hypothetical protein